MRLIDTYFLNVPEHFNQFYPILKSLNKQEYNLQVEIRREHRSLRYLILTCHNICLVLDFSQMKEIHSQLNNIFSEDWILTSSQKNWSNPKIKSWLFCLLKIYPHQAKTGWILDPNTYQYNYVYPIKCSDLDEFWNYSLPSWIRFHPI